MSSTRHASDGSPFRQERYASSEVYKTALSGLLVAKRCGKLAHDPELVELVWFIQCTSLADPFNVGGGAGSVEAMASTLLDRAGYEPSDESHLVERWNLDPHRILDALYSPEPEWHEPTKEDLSERRRHAVESLDKALRRFAVDPKWLPETMPGLGDTWRRVLCEYRDSCRKAVQERLAPTSIAERVARTLRLSMEIGKLVLVTGRSRLGKSAAAKAFCAASGGIARYVLTPEDGDMDSLYRAMAKAIGVADSHSRKASEVRALIERTLMAARLLLVFDEAHNLFSGLRRVTRQPQRVLWLRRLVDAGVPIAFVALPEFETRLKRCAGQLEWDAAQISELICLSEVLPETLSEGDFDCLAERLGAGLSVKSKALVAAAARCQHGAQYIVDTIALARHAAQKAGRATPSDADVREAIGNRPQFFKRKESPAPRTKTAARAERSIVALPAAALRMQSPRTASADILQGTPAG